jgi:hypothetical protein
MRRMRSVMAGITANASGFAAAQAPSSGVPLTLAGTTAPAPGAGQIHNNAVVVSLASAANLSAINFTVVGTDRRGNPQTEIIAGPNNNTVTGHLLFNTVQSITPSASNAGTLTAGWGAINLGPWLITAFHLSSVVAKIIGGSGNHFDVMTTSYDLLDPTVFLPQGQGGTPSGDMTQDGAFGVMNSGQGNGPYLASLPWPLVPAALQAACPQLLSTVNCLPEDDGTYSGMIAAPNTFTTSATQATGTNTANEVRLDPTGAFAWRLQINDATSLISMDVSVVRAAIS